MSTLKVNTIRHTGASSDAVTLASDGTCTAKITNLPSGNRRLTDNGDMRIAQRGTSATVEGYGTVDRISQHHGGEDEDGTQSQHVLTSSDTGPWEKGFRYSYHLQNGNQTSGDGAGVFYYIRHRIEAQDMATCGWDYTSTSSYVTLSFWVKSSVAQNFYGYIQTIDGTDQVYPFETGSLSANTWTKITKTIPGNSNIQFDNDNDLGLQIVFSMFWGTNYTNNSKSLNQWSAYDGSARTPDDTSTWWTTNDATWEITGLQLEVGDVATDFEHRSYGDELARCQRYYQRWAGDHDGNYGISAGYTYSNGVNTATGLNLSQPMRATPTVENITNLAAYVHSQGTSASISSVAFTGYTLNSNWVALGLAHADIGDSNYASTLTNASNKYIALTADL